MRIITTALTAAALAVAPLALAAPAHAGADKIDICHATGNGKYVPLTISKDGTANGHAGADHQNGADIIPAFSWVDKGVRYYFDGQNLDKLDLLANGCKTGPEKKTATLQPPTYAPASCLRPELPHGVVTVPAHDPSTGVIPGEPQLSADGKQWTVTYELAADTDEIDWSFPAGFTGSYSFTVVPLSADPLWITDSRTGSGRCEIADTGAEDWLVPTGAAAVALLAVGAVLRRRFA